MEHSDKNVKATCKEYIEEGMEIFKKFAGAKVLNVLINQTGTCGISCKFYLEDKDNTNGELIWAKVKKVEELSDGFLITAVLSNDPILATRYKIGDIVKFHSNHLYNILVGDCPFLPLDLSREFRLYIKTVEFTLEGMWKLAQEDSTYNFDADLSHYYETTIRKEGILSYTQFIVLVDNVIIKLKQK